MFGIGKEAVWQRIAESTGGRYVEGGFFKSGKVEVTIGPWLLTLDTHAVHTGHATMVFTRMRAPYVNADGFRFRVYRRTLFTGLGKLFGMQDIEIGNTDFDREFVIQGNDESKLRALFGDDEVRRLIDGQPQIHFEVKDDEGAFKGRFPEGVDEVVFQVVGIIADEERLRRLFDLFATTLDRLRGMGSAGDAPAGVQL